METENKKSFLESKKIAHLMTCIIVVVGVIFVFHIGEEFGYRKAELIEHMSDGYYKAFGPGDQRRTGPFGSFFDDQTDTHGVAGKVIDNTANSLIVEDNENIEKTVVFSTSTIIRKQRTTLTTTDIKNGDFVVIIGSPTTDGKITAKIIRIVPPPTAEPDQDNTGTSSKTVSQ